MLAREHALGQIERAEYRRRRADLIDGIVNGDIEIRRQPPARHAAGGFAPVAGTLRRSSVHVAIGVLVLVAIVWLLLPDSETLVEPREDAAPAARPSEGARMPAARALVEGFLRERNWSKESLASFEASWNALTPNEQAQARGAAWFRALVAALRDEINAHKALAEFDGTGRASATGKRLAAFGEFLGVGSELPEMSASAPATPAAGPQSTPAPPVATETAAPALTGSAWLAARADDELTLQLFAANHLDRLETLIAAHPDVDLQLLVFEQHPPPYRLVHGVFATRAAAVDAYRRLPGDLAVAEEPLVRRIAELRTGAAAGVVREPPPQRYTLQVFASASRENVERLISRYPALDMRVQPLSNADASFRVVVGDYPSSEAAQRAAEALPATLIEELGEPLVRPLAPAP